MYCCLGFVRCALIEDVKETENKVENTHNDKDAIDE